MVLERNNNHQKSNLFLHQITVMLITNFFFLNQNWLHSKEHIVFFPLGYVFIVLCACARGSQRSTLGVVPQESYLACLLKQGLSLVKSFPIQRGMGVASREH